MKKENDNRDVEFFYEMGQLRLLNRMWRRFFLLSSANVAEHTLRVLWIALALAKKEGVKDEEKIMKMALVHDITESRTGDTDYISRQYVEQKEEMAIEDILRETILEEDFLSVWKEYGKRESIESKIVKDADNLDVNLELKENGIQTVADKFNGPREMLVKPKLYTKSAKKYWELIGKSDMHDWHVNGRNRFNEGDWKKKQKK
ncbi:MAG: Metal dependent phosphohydrolase [uncultured bacterium]|nr:MAG: Metal dependent phosphohydrolase [uncultured bacterium]KKQ45409.1 MAG: Metal dependent phosphohydrolase [Candidatus Moranbacteria bacterium GW2011_GWC2_37_8]KKQ63372.1 MAG: Metal dependent phosphohydrolase [Parcubacteria group bacterium GW2011_GWC1_38_22]KKQ80965.1 MAG: Metal dependent phosphohydrolase [Candidatus Moranbacteria bacterium GW2011_GWD2_38_7]